MQYCVVYVSLNAGGEESATTRRGRVGILVVTKEKDENGSVPILSSERRPLMSTNEKRKKAEVIKRPA